MPSWAFPQSQMPNWTWRRSKDNCESAWLLTVARGTDTTRGGAEDGRVYSESGREGCGNGQEEMSLVPLGIKAIEMG